MNLAQFLKEDQFDQLFLDSTPVIFSGPLPYPALFFRLLLDYVKKRSIPVVKLDALQGLASIQAQLETSLLGNRTFYWLANVQQLSNKQKDSFLGYIQKYNGPNGVGFFLEKVKKFKNKNTVELSGQLSLIQAQQVASFFGYNSTRQTLFIKKVFQLLQSIPLDQFFLLLEYSLLVSIESDEFFNQWLEVIVPSNQSLFTLSSFLFSKKPAEFFAYWHKIKKNYSLPFWIVFWSEQLYKAHWYCFYLKQKNRTSARKIGFRLPFRFLQQEWKQYDNHQLIHAHNFLYTLDFHVKNGSDDFGIEVFYSKFMTDQFC